MPTIDCRKIAAFGTTTARVARTGNGRSGAVTRRSVVAKTIKRTTPIVVKPSVVTEPSQLLAPLRPRRGERPGRRRGMTLRPGPRGVRPRPGPRPQHDGPAGERPAPRERLRT